jgi:hypothetical protein
LPNKYMIPKAEMAGQRRWGPFCAKFAVL